MRRGAALPLAAAFSLALLPTSAPAAEALPNLRARPAVGLYVETDDGGTTPALRFASDVANVGAAALELQPALDPPDAVRQCASWTGPACTAYLDAAPGGFRLEPGQRCWRIAGIMRYELRMLEPDGTPGDVVVAGDPVAHWLEDERVNASSPPSDPAPRYSLCSLVRLGLSPGWVSLIDGDEHGQWLGLAGVADGTYALVSIVDPAGLIRESDETDNVAWLAVSIADGGTRVEAA